LAQNLRSAAAITISRQGLLAKDSSRGL